nr:uncharacterized protein LOC111420084 [Onthophagus taurus]
MSSTAKPKIEGGKGVRKEGNIRKESGKEKEREGEEAGVGVGAEEEVYAFGRRGSVQRSPPKVLQLVERMEEAVRPVAAAYEDEGAVPRNRSASLSSATERKRKKCEMDVSLDPEKVDGTSLERMRAVKRDLQQFLINDPAKLSKNTRINILERFNKVEELFQEMVIESQVNKRLIEDLKMKINLPAVVAAPSFARVVSSRVQPETEEKNVIIIRGKEESMLNNSELVKKAVCDEMVKGLKTVKIRNLRKIRDNGVVIETETKEDLEIIKRSGKLTEMGLKVEAPKKSGPTVIIYDVEKDVSTEELINEIAERNLGVTAEEIKAEVRIRSRDVRREGNRDRSNIILEVSPRIRRGLVCRGRVFVRSFSYKVSDIVLVLRCNKCLAFGHVARFCERNAVCRVCGEEGHVGKDCVNKEKPKTCPNCRLRNRDARHSVLDTECPEYRRALEMSKSRIDNG